MSVRRLGALALAALLLVGCHRAPAQARPGGASPALWEVTGRQGQHGWLFGTIHSLPDGVRWETPVIDSALGRTGVLVVEIANLSDSAAGKAAFDAASRRGGLPPLLSRIPASERPEVGAALARAHLSESDFAQVETWAAALGIASTQDPGDTGNGVDLALLNRRLPVVGLESFAEQFAMFERLSDAEQAKLLHFAAAPQAADGTTKIAGSWLKGDLSALEREAMDAELSDPGLREALLVRRNEAWAAHIAALLREGKRPFVAVGAGHMLGSAGLPALLAAQGYTVRRIE